jgi:hypothetical protein
MGGAYFIRMRKLLRGIVSRDPAPQVACQQVIRISIAHLSFRLVRYCQALARGSRLDKMCVP